MLEVKHLTVRSKEGRPHCFFGAMPSMTPHTFSLSQVDGSQEFFDAITAVKQTDDPAEVLRWTNDREPAGIDQPALLMVSAPE